MNNIHIVKHKTFKVGSHLSLASSQLSGVIDLIANAEPAPKTVLSGRTQIKYGQLDKIGAVVLKPYFRGGIVRHFIKQSYVKWGKPRSQKEYEMLLKMSQLKINAPNPIAFIFQGRLFYQAWLVMAQIPDVTSIAQLMAQKSQFVDKAIQKLSTHLKTLIENRIWHVDLHPGNVLWDRQEAVWIIDFDKSRQWHKDTKNLAQAYINRWNRAIQKHQLPNQFQHILEKYLLEKLEEKLIKK